MDGLHPENRRGPASLWNIEHNNGFRNDDTSVVAARTSDGAEKLSAASDQGSRPTIFESRVVEET